MVALKPESLAHLSFRCVSEEHLVYSFDIPQPSPKPCRILQFHVRCFESGRVTVNSGLSPVSSIFHLVSVFYHVQLLKLINCQCTFSIA